MILDQTKVERLKGDRCESSLFVKLTWNYVYNSFKIGKVKKTFIWSLEDTFLVLHFFKNIHSLQNLRDQPLQAPGLHLYEGGDGYSELILLLLNLLFDLAANPTILVQDKTSLILPVVLQQQQSFQDCLNTQNLNLSYSQNNTILLLEYINYIYGEYSSNIINTLSLIKVDLFFPWRIIIQGNKVQI